MNSRIYISWPRAVKDIQVRIIFVRDRNYSKNRLAILSTNTELPDEKIVRLYGKRWDIECFFKVAKSHLALGKEFQCLSYDAMVAHTTIVFTRYIMLAIRTREEKDPRTIGQLFYLCCDELEDIRFAEAILLVLDCLKASLAAEPAISEEMVQPLLDNLFRDIPAFLKRAFTPSNSGLPKTLAA